MKTLLWGVGLAACLALATLLIALQSQEDGKLPLETVNAQSPSQGGPRHLTLPTNFAANSAQRTKPNTSSRAIQGLPEPKVLPGPSSSQIELYSYYAQLWGYLHPVSASWYVSWADLFEGTSTALPRHDNTHGLDIITADETATSSDLNLAKAASCWNDKHFWKDMDWNSAMQDDLASLKVVAAFWARGHEHHTSSVSIVTTANMARLDQLRAQCLAWEGPLSVALYHPVLQDEAKNFTKDSSKEIMNAITQIAKLVADMQRQPTACKLRVMLTAEVITERRAMILFPVNTLRNLARLQTETPLIALLDVDLLPSKSLYKRTQDLEDSKNLIEQSKTSVFVIPGFEVQEEFEHAPWADALASGNKDMVVTAFNQQVVIPFHIKRYPAGHAPTQYAEWIKANADYTIKYAEGYEPWLIGSRLGMPWHDERYRGFGKNKVQHILNLCLLSYKFKVLHDSYAVHRPHDLSSSAVTFFTKTDQKSGQKNELKIHMSELLEWQEAAGPSFKPVLTSQTHRCMKTLPWWQSDFIQPPLYISSITTTSTTKEQPSHQEQHLTIVIGETPRRPRPHRERRGGWQGLLNTLLNGDEEEDDHQQRRAI